MRNLNAHGIDKFRLKTDQVLAIYGSFGDSENGIFDVVHPVGGIVYRVVASSGDGWEHVSVSLKDNIPTWDDMEFIKHIFFNEDEYAFQLHVPPDEHINVHNNCLHMWRPIHKEIPIPPKYMV